ncbi:similar to Saccharomyces cerevisiae YGL139W FLC3 Putative FAD transporter, similar to Flc1p and Flc2p [Maudiozyma saulgeensis]|uniref:Similar to Saccharomyces cerevisiae YGL139W FLC3 Putative FAD transporter, similar to Flc1p and Flc2p n=1 Tax=Maudiozyma saulgeensis TaxID=1789683 RepID=A0A1X7R7C8_9SACH|nr:similar to Saccharomyces cerevisiae YGL139W FLC3 Putative FAD transporter, similar to Flc1p and Flc2p [Kazachstania saulgeensis]
MNPFQIIWYLLPFILFSTTEAKRNLKATSLVTCMKGSQVSSNSFDVVFEPDDRSLHYTLDLQTEIDSYILAYIDVYAYGFKIITKNFDVCSENWKQFCPVHPGNIEIDSIEYISEDYVNEIPNIAYSVPDIDAYVRVNVYDRNLTSHLACIEIFFSNGKTVSQTGVKWASAVIAGIGLLLSAVLSAFGNSTAASHISANTMSLFLYFQSVAVIGMQHVHSVPPIAAAWCENMAWSMGLIYIHFMQKIFRWYVEATGGTPALYLTSTSQSVLTQRSWDYLKNIQLFKRAENVLYGNVNTLIFRGIKRLGYSMGIENTSIVCTGFTFFVLCGYVLAGFIMVCKYSIYLAQRAGWVKPQKFREFNQNWRVILKGSLLRYIYIGFTQLTILGFWEFTERDSAAVIVISCLFIVLSVGLMVWAGYRTCYFGKKSIETYNNPAALLYGDERVLNKYGFFYTMFNATHYWWNVVLVSYIFIKSLFIGFAQASGKTQALAIFILDLAYFIAVIRYKPYLDRLTNFLNIFICTITVVNSFLFMFFSDLFGQPYAVSAIMGWVFFIMNAAFSFILLMLILVYTGMILFSKNPDIRFKPARDDRTSFQRHDIKGDDVKVSINDDLMALGNIAKDHAENWEYDMQHNPNENIFLGSDEENEYSTSSDLNRNIGRKPTLTQKIFGKFGRKQRNDMDEKDGVNNSYLKEDGDNGTYDYTTSSTSKSTSPTKKYPGLEHQRENSETGNGLIGSYESEALNFNKPSTVDLQSTSGGISSTGFSERDFSMNSLQQEQRKTDVLHDDFL